MCLETNFLKYSDTSITTLDMNNFAGLGAVDGNGRRQALKFNTQEEGIKCHIQHLYAYCTKDKLPNGEVLIDPRFKYVNRGCAPNVEDLGNGKWASDKQYANKLLDLLNRLKNIKIKQEGEDKMLSIQRKLVRYNYSGGNNIKYIVVHDTGNTGRGANANAHYNYFNGGDRQSSAHYFVDDNNIIQIIEDCNASWHCGDGGGRYGISNHNSIGIEICINSDGNYNKAVSNAIDLVKYKMKQYGIPVNRVVRHYDASRKNCPASMSSNGWAKWNWFKSQLNGEGKPTAVVIAQSGLNVRSQKSTSSSKLGILANGQSVDVYRIEGDWVHIYYPPNGGYVAKQYVNLYNIDKLKKQEQREEYDMDKIVLYYGDVDAYSALIISQKYNCPMMKEMDYKKKNIKAKEKIIIGGPGGTVTGSDRFETFKAACKLL